MTAIHALLVGIDRYEPERFSNGLPIPSLAGAVNDVVRFRRFLEKGPFAVSPERIRQLVSPHAWSEVPIPGPKGLPTRDNLLWELRALKERAAPGDQALIHFSGHGARLPTVLPEMKGEVAWDECLVPSDAGEGVDRCIRDVEINRLLADLVSRGIRATLVLDCCHSGGLTRKGRTFFVRGLGALQEDRVASQPTEDGPESCAPPTGLPKSETRSVTWRRLAPHPGWLPLPKGCVSLAACGPTELAREYPLGAEGYNGAFTHHLLRTMGDAGRPLSLGELHRRLLGRVRSLSHSQTPVLQGDGGSLFLGDGRENHRSAAGESYRSLLVDPSSTLRPYSVTIAGPRRLPGRHGARTGFQSRLEELRQALSEEPGGFLDSPSRPSPGQGLAVEVTDSGRLRILDGDGVPISRLGEEVAAEEPDAVRRVMEILEHVAHYRAIESLAGPEVGKDLLDAVATDLFALERIEDWRSPARQKPVDRGAVSPGSLLCLVLHNRASRELSISVLGLFSDWQILRLHPYPGDGESSTLDPGAEQPVFFRAHLPEELVRGRDRILVLIATRPMATGHLERPALSELTASGSSIGGIGAPSGAVSLSSRDDSRNQTHETREDLEEVWAVLAVDLILQRPRPSVPEAD